ncbi:MAG: LamG domain-containing protein [Candidatus Marinimicrobia bacterium]|nr:LamG domain-containing protein [Candidatus Neomarinimicrobiota bacterium]
MFSTVGLLVLMQCSEPAPFYQSIKLISDDASISYLEIDTLNTAHLTGAFTWEFWFHIAELTADSPCLLMVPDADDNNDLAIYIDRTTGKTITIFYANNQLTASTTTNLLDGQFHSLALANDNAGRLVLFVDGARCMVRNHSWTLNPTGRRILIGGDWDPGQTTPDNGWTGWLDEVRLWTTALADSELTFHGQHIEKLTQHYNPVLLEELKGLWRFNTTDKSLNVVPDEHPGSGERPALVLHGEVTWTETAVR